MPRTAEAIVINGLTLERSHHTPMHRQLYEALRRQILSGALEGGSRMPSSRLLAQQIGVSRFTVATALEQLTAEGYLQALPGSGTFVETIPSRYAGDRAHPKDPTRPSDPVPEAGMLSKRAQAITWRQSRVSNKSARYLHMSIPDHRLFPVSIWNRLTKAVLIGMDRSIACYSGFDEPSDLEVQIATHIAAGRGIRCDPEDVVTTFGAHHAVSLAAELLTNPGDIVAFEEPGMPAVRSIFEAMGCRVQPMMVDAMGANPASVGSPNVKLAYVTAAKQQPLTIEMGARRKIELLNWANDTGAILVEDGLGSEFRYQGRPIPPLKAMDRGNRVIYVGAFSMSLLQTLRVGYMILPRPLAQACRKLIQIRYRAMPQIVEAVIARFIAEGHYARHLHKMRRIYAMRQAVLHDLIARELSDLFEPPAHAAGFYNLCYFRDQSINDDALLSRCAAAELGIEQLSYYHTKRNPPRKAFLLGFASSTEKEIKLGLDRLKHCAKSVPPA